jgi:hypothetical protein
MMNFRILFIGVFCMVAATSCFKEGAYNKPDVNSLIQLSADTLTEIAADGVSHTLLTARISKDASPDRKKVIFRTSLGSFESGTADSVVVTAGQDFTATAFLTSVKVGKALVTASILGNTAVDSPEITFIMAYPTKIKVSVDSFQIYTDYSSQSVVTAALSTDNGGKPSSGQRVDFDVQDDNGNPVGSFLNNIAYGTTGLDGKATIRYSAGPGHQPGYLKITAQTQKAGGGAISANTQIYLSNLIH